MACKLTLETMKDMKSFVGTCANQATVNQIYSHVHVDLLIF